MKRAGGDGNTGVVPESRQCVSEVGAQQGMAGALVGVGAWVGARAGGAQVHGLTEAVLQGQARREAGRQTDRAWGGS